MLKKIVALLLTLTLGFGTIQQAQAARVENNIYLTPSAFSSNDNVGREFSNFSTVNIVMAPGEWTVTPAFHAIDGWILSYSGLNANSSDPYVAEARPIYVGASAVGGVANSFIGIEIHAKNPGTAVVTVNYGTFVTNSRFEDKRATTPYSVKTFVVTVLDNALSMDVSMSANEVVLDWPDGYRNAVEKHTKGMTEVGEGISSTLMSAGLTTMITGGALLAGVGVAAALGVAAGALVVPAGALAMAGMALGTAIGLAVNVGMEQNKGAADPLTNTVKDAAKDVALEKGLQGLPGMKELVDVAEMAYKGADADLNNQLRKFPYPTFYPGSVDVYVRLTNNSSFDIHNVMLNFSTDNLSMTSSNGPWHDTHPHFVGVVPANKTVYEKVTVFPKESYHHGASGAPQLMYTGTVAVQCSYHDFNTRTDVVLNDSSELGVYTKLNMQDQATASNFVAPNAEVRASYIMCPVDVQILDKEGNLLATLTTDGEPYQDEFIVAGSQGDVKYFIVPQNKKTDYQLRIIAVEDGEMSIVGVDSGEATNMTVFERVSIKKGDSFVLDLTGAVAAVLHAVKEDGTQEQLEATLTLNEASIAAALEQTDVSAEKRAKVAHALSCSLVPIEVLGGSFQEPITLETGSALMLNLFEKLLGMLPGSLTDMYLIDNAEAAPVSMPIAVAVWKGLLDIQYYDVAMAEDAATRLLTNEEVLMLLNNFRDIMQETSDFSYQMESLNLEQMICMVDTMWEVMCAADKEAALVAELTSEMRGAMSSKAIEDEAMVLFYHENETQNAVLQNSMMYLPTARSQMEYDLTQIIRKYNDLQEAGIHPGEVVDMSSLDRREYDILVGSVGGGEILTDEQGWHYTWYPFYFSVKQGEIYKDMVYLFVSRGMEGADVDLLAEYGYENNGDNRIEYYIIADQERVGNFLAEQYLLDKLTTTAEYTELKRGSEGEDVRRLQEVLIAYNWLSQEDATGVYDTQTQKAVKELQKRLELKTNGIADASFQRILYGEMLVEDIALEEWLAPYVKQAERNAYSGFTQMVRITGSANIRAEANADSRKITSAKAGETFVCLGVEDNGWYRLRLEDGSEGFVSGKLAEIVE